MLGSYSIGYGLVKAGFPKIQKRNIFEKIAFGYMGGIILFGIPLLVMSAFKLLDIYYFVICVITYLILTLALLLKRTLLNEQDSLTQEEERELNKKNSNTQIPSNQTTYSNPENETNEELPNLNDQTSASQMNFEKGLMIRSRKNEGQVFKERNKSDISRLRDATNRLEQNESEEQKNSILAKLRSYAQEISNTKKVNNPRDKTEEEEDLESEEELLNMFKDEQ